MHCRAGRRLRKRLEDRRVDRRHVLPVIAGVIASTTAAGCGLTAPATANERRSQRFSMTPLGMILRKVDPFAVYAAERQLAAHGRSIPRGYTAGPAPEIQSRRSLTVVDSDDHRAPAIN